MPHGLWDLSSLIRDGTHAPCIGSLAVLTARPQRKSWVTFRVGTALSREFWVCWKKPASLAAASGHLRQWQRQAGLGLDESWEKHPYQ